MNISFSAERQADGTVRCTVDCDGQQVTMCFTGDGAFIEVPQPEKSPA